MNLYQTVLESITPFFASQVAAEQFLLRQCEFHLKIDPQRLGAHDLVNLSKWAMVSGGLLIGKEKAEAMSEKILTMRRVMSTVPLRDRMSGGDFQM
ncbi:MAG: hypothetical protein HZB51_24885 [Chloroflexi bacterium]|nr:hypothetical protein [Chloroflexota bacterium]